MMIFQKKQKCMPKAFFWIMALPAGLLVLEACASKPQSGGTDAPAAAVSGESAGTGVDADTEESGVFEALPLVEIPAPEPKETASIGELAEPEIDLAETTSPKSLPEESRSLGALPEPQAPPLSSPLQPPPPRPAPVQPPPAPPQSVPRPEPPRPQPPAHLGPAEDERPPAIVREPPPIPSAPQPEPPATPLLSETPDEEVVFSRTVRATAGQLIEIPFRGTGWVYLGELASRRGIIYESRRLDPEGQSFIFRAEAAGTYSLKFYKQDFIREFILNDYVQVLVGEAPASPGAGWFNPPVDRGRVAAEPRWPSSLEEARRGSHNGQTGSAQAVQPESSAQAAEGAAQSGTSAQAPGTAPPQTTKPSGRAVSAGDIAPGIAPAPMETPPPDSALMTDNTASPVANTAQVPQTMPPDSPPESFLQKAREEFEAGRTASAIALLDQFRERYPAGSDEAYWLYGQFYEANSPSRDILTALDYYRRLVREYPQSGRYNDARRRIAYLERYYINIQ